MSNGNRSGWAIGMPVLAVLLFAVRLMGTCGRSHSSSYNYNLPTPPPNIDYTALLGMLDAGSSLAKPTSDDADVLAFDATNVYVADPREKAIFAYPKAGGAKKQLTRTNGVVHGMAVGATDVYFTVSFSLGSLHQGSLMSVPTRGGIATAVVPAGLYFPERVVADTRALFFTAFDQGPKRGGGGALRVSLGGGVTTPLDVDPNAPPAWSAVADDTNVYFTTIEGTRVASVPKTGGETKTLSSDFVAAREIVADADALYFTDTLAEKVYKLPKRGGVPTVVATGETNLGAVAVDGSSVYWTTTTSGAKLSTIMRASKSGGAARAVAQGLRNARNVVSDGTKLYWSQSGTVYWVAANDPIPTSGGAKVHALGTDLGPVASALDAGIASRGGYGTGSGGGSRVIRTFRSKDR